MHQLDLVHVLDWAVPATLLAIAWFLKKLDGSISRLGEALGALSTAVAVLQSRIDGIEDRVERVERSAD